MNRNPGWSHAPPFGHSDLDSRLNAWKGPQHCRSPVGSHCPRAASQTSGHQTLLPGLGRSADSIDPPVRELPPPGRHPRLDVRLREARSEGLPSANQSMLPLGKRGNRTFGFHRPD
jgi:hypothetical protein